ncbi:hypothetical protein P3F83_22015 [Mycobacteroides immunogenum]|nr:hypothetical protein [Mycobacteroides immunogenum]WJR33124.1 hypothetical protein P3F83_22015 [Mycobacteroides immunogenum]
MQDRLLERASAWCGLAYLLVFGTGWLAIAHFMPPIPPAAGPAAVAAQFQERHGWLMLAAVIMMCSTFVLFPVFSLLVMIARKIEGSAGIVTIMMALTAATSLVFNFYVPFSFSMAAFRPDRDPAIVQYASDNGFLQFMGGIPMFLLVWVLSAYAILVLSPRRDPLVPRWFGYLNLWCAILYLPELLVFFFHTGPFAWNGIVGFWIPAVLFLVYFAASPIILVPVVRKMFSAPAITNSRVTEPLS